MPDKPAETQQCWNCGDEIPAAAEVCETCGVAQKRDAKAPAAPRNGPLEIGDVLAGRYEIRGTTAEGGLGAVYKVQDREIGVSLALKTIRSDLVGDEESRKSLRKVIKKARRFLHKNVVKVYESGEDNDRFFFTMEFLGGIHLRKLLQVRSNAHQHFTLEESAPILEQIADALDAAHRDGVTHGNLKPENIAILPQGLKISEFALATFLLPAKLVEIQKGLGTEKYIAPEVAKGEAFSPRSDIYSVGAIFYEMLTGVAPDPNPPLASEINEAIPAAVDELLQRCLEEDPLKRPATTGEIYDVVAQAAGLKKPSAKREEAPKEEKPREAGKEEAAPPPKEKEKEKPAAKPAAEKAPESPAKRPEAPVKKEEPRPEPKSAPEAQKKEKIVEEPPRAAEPWKAATPPPPPPAHPKEEMVVERGPPTEPVKPEPRKAPADVKFPGEQTLQEAIEKDKKPAPHPPRPAAPQPPPPATAPQASSAQGGGSMGKIIAVVVIVAAVAGGGVFFALSGKKSEAEKPVAVATTETPKAATQAPAPKAAPTPPPAAKPQAAPATPPAPTRTASAPKEDEAARRAAEEARQREQEELARKRAEEDQRRRAEEERRKQEAAAAAAAKAAAASRCGPGMVEIKGGSFPMGSASNDTARDAWEKSNTPTDVKTFCIDAYEFPGEKGQLPRQGVSWEQARALCSARKKRLCTEEEWEKACKGSKHGRYPYGNQFNPNACVTKGSDGSRQVAPVGSLAECKSDYGVYDMSGNLKEWTASNWSDVVNDKVVRGGSFSRPDWATRCAFRENFRADYSDDQVGFRCCSD